MIEKMRTNNDCGPVVAAILTKAPYDRVMSLWPGGFHGNSSDSFIHHQGVLARLGFGWETKSLSDLRSRMPIPMKTGILMNSKNNPKTWVREDFVYLHWVVLQSYSDSGIFVHWGDGRIRHFAFDELSKHMTNPFSVAYEVVERIDVDLPWHKRLYKRLTSYLGKLWSSFMKRILVLIFLVLLASNCFAQVGPSFFDLDEVTGAYDAATAASAAAELSKLGAMELDGSNAADLVDLPNRVRAVFASITQDLDVGGNLEVTGRIDGTNASFTGSVDVGGNLAVGLTNPLTRLHVLHSPGVPGLTGITIQNGAELEGYGCGIFFKQAASASDYRKAGVFFASDASGHGRGSLRLAVNNAASSSGVTLANTRLMITSGGTVGIATTTPDVTKKLHVVGDVRVDGDLEVTTINNVTPWDNIEKVQALGILHPSATRWGIKIAKTNSDPLARVEYIYDAVGFAPAQMNLTTNVMDYGGWEAFCNLYNRPVMLTYAGTVDYELASSSQLLKAAGGASNATDTAYAGNAMSEFKLLWLATFEDATHYYIIFSDAQYSRDYNAYAFTDENGVIRDVMYYGMYEGIYADPRLRSMATGTVMVSQTGQVEITRALANNSATPTDPDGWYINYWSQRNFVMYLSWLISKSTDSQAAFGNGNSNSAAYVNPGSLIAQPRFWGSSAENVGVKLFYIENFWGNYWNRCAGLLFNSNAKIMSRGYGPYNETGEGYAINPISPTGTSGTGSLITGYVGDYGFIPLVSGGSTSQYFNSGFWYTTPAINTTRFALVGGSRSYSSQCGASTVHLFDPLSGSWSSIGASLSFLKCSK